MRNLKRALSLALASIMVLGMMVVGAGAVSVNDFSDGEKIVNKEAVSVLTTLNVINGKDDGSYDPEGTVTRAEMAKMICVILNGGKDPSLGNATTNTFTDTVGHWASPYIEYCTKLGIISGRGDGTFDPNGNVTGSEAAKMLLAAAGYQAAIEGFTGANWEIATNVRANQVDLYEDVTIAPSAELNRDNAAQMVYNTLDIKVVTYKYTLTTDGSSVSSVPELVYTNATGDKDITVLEDKFGAVKVEGIVVGNAYADMSSSKTNTDYAAKDVVIGSAMDSDKTSILVTNGDDQKEYTDKEYTFTVTTGADVLGRSVYLYVKPASTSQKSTVIGSVILSADNKVVADYSDDSIKEVADDNDLDLTSATMVAYNYSSLQKLGDSYKTNVDTGVEKLLIDTDDDGDVEYVLLNANWLGKVNTKSTKDDGSINVALNSGSFKMDDSDKIVGFDDVSKDDMVLTAFIGGRLYVEKAEAVTGTIEAYKVNSTTTLTTQLTVDGTDYKVSNVAVFTDSDITAANTKADKTMLDTDATFYLDKQGYIMAMGDVVETAYNYAFVWGSEKGTSVRDDQVKVTLSDGTTGTYKLHSDSDLKITADEDGLGEIYAYSLSNNGNTIKLLDPKGGMVAADTPVFEKGKSTVKISNVGTDSRPDDYKGKTTVYANNSSVFFYVTMDGTDVDKVTAYVGRSKAPTLGATTAANTVYLAMGRNNDVGAVSFVGVSSKESAGDHLFVYSAGSVRNDYLNANVYLNGKTEGETIKVSSIDGAAIDYNPELADGLYLYTIDSDGYYELTDPDGESFYVAGANVDRTYSSTIVLDTADGDDVDEFLITKDTIVIDNTDHPSVPDAIANGSVSKGDKVWLLENSDNEVLMLVVDNTEKTDDSKPGTVTKDAITAPKGTSISVETEADTTTVTLKGTDVLNTLTGDDRTDMKDLFGDGVVTDVDTGKVADGYSVLTLDVLSMISRGTTYTIRQENDALTHFYPGDFADGVKTKTYTHSDLRDNYAVIVGNESSISLTITSYDAKDNIIETIYVDIDATGIAFKTAD